MSLVGRPALYDNVSDIQIEAEKYFAECEDKGKRPSITGLAYSLGFESRQSFYDYEARGEFSYMIKRMRLFVESGYEEALAGNNVAGAIFALKNMGWKDKTETEHSGKLEVGKPSWFDGIEKK
jgi:hypothetical protein